MASSAPKAGGRKLGTENLQEALRALKGEDGKGDVVELYMFGARNGDEGAKAIGKTLKSNGTLTSLVLDTNQIGYEGAKAIGEGLKSNGSLTRLNLYSNQIGNEGAKAIGEALKSNGTLTSLDLELNQIGAEGAIALFCSLEHRGSSASGDGSELSWDLGTKVPATSTFLQTPTPALEMIKRLIENGKGDFAVNISRKLGTRELIAFATGWRLSKQHEIMLLMPPEPVIRRGAENIKSFFDALTSQGPNSELRQKLMILGNAAAGKTSMQNSLRNQKPSFTTSGPDRATLSVAIVPWKPKSRPKMKSSALTKAMAVAKAKAKARTETNSNSEHQSKASIIVFDFGGQKEYLVTHTLFLSGRAMTVLLFNINDFSKNMDKFDEIFQDCIMFWVRKIRARAQVANILFVASHCARHRWRPFQAAKEQKICARILDKVHEEEKKDLDQLRAKKASLEKTIQDAQASFDETQSLFKVAKQIAHIQETLRNVNFNIEHRPTFSDEIYRISSVTGYGLQQLEDAVLTQVEKTAFQLPQSYVTLSEKLAEKAASMTSQLPVLRLKEVEEIEAEMLGTTNPTGNVKHALEFLHDFGVIHYYQGTGDKESLVFPDPSALVNGLKELVRHDMVVGHEGGEPYLKEVIRRANEPISDPSQQWDEQQIIEEVRRSNLLRLDLLKYFDVWDEARTSGSFQQMLELVHDLDFTFTTKGSDGNDYIFLYYPMEQQNDDETNYENSRILGIQQGYKIIADWRYHFNGFLPSGLFQRLIVRFHALNPRDNPEEDFEVSSAKQKIFSKMKFSASSSPSPSGTDKMMIEVEVVDDDVTSAAYDPYARKELILRLHVSNDDEAATPPLSQSEAFQRTREAWEVFRKHVRNVEALLAETPGLDMERLAFDSSADSNDLSCFPIEECEQARSQSRTKMFSQQLNRRRGIPLDSLIGPPTSAALVPRPGAETTLPQGFVNHILLVGSEANGSHQVQLLANEFRVRGFVVDIAHSPKQVRGQVRASFCIIGFLTKGVLQTELFQLVLAEGMNRGRNFAFFFEEKQGPSKFVFSEVGECSEIIRPMVQHCQSEVVFKDFQRDRKRLREDIDSVTEALLVRVDLTLFRETQELLDGLRRDLGSSRQQDGPITFLSQNDFDRSTWRQCESWLDRALPEQEGYARNPMESRGFLVEAVHPLPSDELAFHGFMSHYQGTGGGQCHVLFTELERRGLKVWYDMNQQDRNSKGMAKGVNRSAWYLLFLSKDVFTRDFVLFELVCALAAEKPIILVYEDVTTSEMFDFTTWGTSQEEENADNAPKIPDEVKYLLPDLLQVKPCYKRSELISSEFTAESKCDELKSCILAHPEPGSKLEVDQNSEEWKALRNYVEKKVGEIPRITHS